jgi:hypothetical protein
VWQIIPLRSTAGTPASSHIQDHSGLNLEDKPVVACGPILYVTIIVGDVIKPGVDQLAEFDKAA